MTRRRTPKSARIAFGLFVVVIDVLDGISSIPSFLHQLTQCLDMLAKVSTRWQSQVFGSPKNGIEHKVDEDTEDEKMRDEE